MAIHKEMEEQMFGKKCLQDPAETMVQRVDFDL